LANAGQKGVAVVPRFRDMQRLFFLQIRPFDPDVSELLSDSASDCKGYKWTSAEKLIGRTIPLVTVISLPLQHCPACGFSMKKLIRKNLAAFDKTATETAHLWNK